MTLQRPPTSLLRSPNDASPITHNAVRPVITRLKALMTRLRPLASTSDRPPRDCNCNATTATAHDVTRTNRRNSDRSDTTLTGDDATPTAQHDSDGDDATATARRESDSTHDCDTTATAHDTTATLTTQLRPLTTQLRHLTTRLRHLTTRLRPLMTTATAHDATATQLQPLTTRLRHDSDGSRRNCDRS